MENVNVNHSSIRSGSKRNCASKWKPVVLSFVSVLILVATIATWVTRDTQEQTRLGLVSSSDEGPIPTIFGGQLQGSPLKQNLYDSSELVSPEAWTNAPNRAELAMTQELKYLIEVMSPIVSQISERVGTHHTDFIASRRNDETIVIKGSPQHNALVWLSHAIVCKGKNPNDYATNQVEECVSLLSHSQLLNRYSLVTIYFAWSGKTWKNADGWLSYHSGGDNPVPRINYDFTKVDPRKLPSDVCLWKGVTCRQHMESDRNETSKSTGNVKESTGVDSNSNRHEEEEQIIGLDLSANNLVGYIGAVKELRFLTYLEVFDLSQNQLEGLVPKEFGMLNQLLSLDLSQNSLSGSLPLSISKNLTKLEIFRVQDNFLAGGLEFYRFAPPCNLSKWKEFSADCFGDKPRVSCPCCTSCCGEIPLPSGSLRGVFGESAKNENIVCEQQNSRE
eukprot:CAMPEP_0116133390 /NCGR_PEP_ID=MMETSP0329-20121206/10080_1 /TAXON_ID=697910 /ORGANISM="Pseudo-nitzschia arenysensis, Strain B593" /LENGTH=446 /DNA_ID=CAMNT_0003628017 /DNA_START=217 /DNA_END=1557 /DNA_ORIENTATION=+